MEVFMSLKSAIMDELSKGKGSQNPSVEKQSSNRHKPMSRNKSTYPDDLKGLLIKSRLDKLFYLRDEKDEERAGLHASAIIVSDNEFCYRAQVLSLLYKQNQGEQLPINLLRIFAAGTSIHEKWQHMFIKAGIAEHIEARHYSEEYELYFTPDAVINLDGTKYIVEIKSMNTFAYQKAKSHPSGQKQLQLYMHLLGISQGFVLAEDKNNQDWQPFMCEYDPEQVLPFLGRLNQVQEMKKAFVKSKEIPPRKCKNSETSRAKSCNMRDACFNIGNKRVDL